MKNKLGMLVLILLVLVSLFAPRLLFAIQDSVRFVGIKTGQYESWDITNLVTDYEISLSRRLSNFAKGLKAQKSYYVTTLESGSNKDAYDMMEQAWNQELLLRLLDAGLFNEKIYSAYNIEQWKRYVVYDKDYENGVAFLLEYVKISTMEDVTIELLMDTQTGTVYYARAVTGAAEVSAKIQKNPFYYIDSNNIYYILADYYEAELDDNLTGELYVTENVAEEQVVLAEPGTEVVAYILLDTGGCIRLNMEYADGYLEGILQLTRADNNCLIMEIGLSDIGELIPALQIGEYDEFDF